MATRRWCSPAPLAVATRWYLASAPRHFTSLMGHALPLESSRYPSHPNMRAPASPGHPKYRYFLCVIKGKMRAEGPRKKILSMRYSPVSRNTLYIYTETTRASFPNKNIVEKQHLVALLRVPSSVPLWEPFRRLLKRVSQSSRRVSIMGVMGVHKKLDKKFGDRHWVTVRGCITRDPHVTRLSAPRNFPWRPNCFLCFYKGKRPNEAGRNFCSP